MCNSFTAPTGSSPPARGTPRSPRWQPTCIRFIPACAGNTRECEPPRLPSTVHPRLRGEHGATLINAEMSTGSSPPARGTRVERRHQWPWCRFIPACAGNTWAAPPFTPQPAVHPRLRGEHNEISMKTTGHPGSSPPARGTRPAGLPLPRGMAVHPRLRGEHASGSCG